MMKKITPSLIFKWLILLVMAFVFLLPFFVLIRNAVVSDRQILSPMASWLPWPMQIGKNFKEVLNHPTANIINGLKNSAIIASIQTFVGVLITMLAGYAMARIPYKHRNLFFTFVLLTLMIPGQVIFIPTYVVVSKLKLVNTYWGLILPGLFNAFNAAMFRQYFLNFPREIEESGFLDGLGYFGVFFRLVMPNAKPIIIALCTLGFMGSWNAFLWPLVVGQDPSMWTAQISLSTLISGQRVIIHQVFMAGLIVIIPTAIVFFFLQKHLVKGVTFSGVKG